MWQTRVLISTAFVYIGYYIIRLIFTVQQNDISKAYGFSMGQNWDNSLHVWDWLWNFKAYYGNIS